MTRGALLLADFLEARRLRRSEAAALLGVSRPLVTMWLGSRGKPPAQKPNMHHRRRIREATKGHIPLRAWDEAADPRRAA